jgi:serine/threonine protein kinase
VGKPPPCPDESDLLAGLCASSNAPEREALISHIDRCNACRHLVAQVLRDEGVASSAAGSATIGAPPVQSFRVGERVLDRFEVVRFIARGGMGEVFEIRDHALDETLALKTVAAMVADEPEALARFRREVQLARKVTHPNVCRILEFGCHRRQEGHRSREIPFLVMEYLRGRTLRAHVREGGPMREADIERVALQMADGLRAIHTAGIVHRDFKGDNVFLVHGPEGPRAVLVDFGLARPLDARDGRSVGSRPALIGTPQYMAPEQLLGAPATIASDLYAFGVVLFEMWTGQRPFGDDGAAPLRRVEESAPRIGLRRRDVPPPWEAVVERCLARAPEDRFRDVDEMVATLRGPTSVTRGRARWPTVATAAMLCLGLAGVAWGLRRSPIPAESPDALGAGPIPSGLGGTPAPEHAAAASRSSPDDVPPAPRSEVARPSNGRRHSRRPARPAAAARATAERAAPSGPAGPGSAGDGDGAVAPPARGDLGDNTLARSPGEATGAEAPASAPDGGNPLTAPAGSRSIHPDDVFDPFE